MRILHITAQKPDSTGSGIYLTQTTLACKRLGHEQAVIYGIDAQDEPILPKGVQMFPVRFNTPELPFDVCGMSDEMPYPSTKYRDLTPQMQEQFEHAFMSMLDTALAEFKPEVIVCNHLYLLTAAVREHVPNLPIVAICHNTCLRQLEQHDLCNERIIESIRKVDLLLALHGEQRERIIKLFGVETDHVKIIGSAYNAQIFNLGDRVIPEEPGGPTLRNLVYAGKITYKKGINSLLSAVSMLKVPPKTINLRLCGGMNNSFQRTALELLINENPQNVEYLGILGRHRLADEYRRAHIFTLASYYEGLPLCIIEALACGCKVVVTDLPGLQDWVKESIPDAPIWFVTPPRMQGVDDPLKRDLPAFEKRIADAIEEAAAAKPRVVDVSHLSWTALAERLTAYCNETLN